MVQRWLRIQQRSHCCGSDLISGPRTFACHRRSPPKIKNEKGDGYSGTGKAIINREILKMGRIQRVLELGRGKSTFLFLLTSNHNFSTVNEGGGPQWH